MRGVVGDSPLNILYLTAPGSVGGLETVVLALATGLTSRRHRVTVAAAVSGSPDSHPLLDRLRSGGIGVVPMPAGYAAERRAVTGLARELGADVVHSHGYRSDVLLRSVRGGLGRPIVTTIHGFTGGGVKNRFYEWLQVRAIRGFDAVIAVSTPLGKLLEAGGVAPRHLQVLPNAYAPDEPLLPRAEARVRVAPDVTGPLIGWAGRLSREKGCDVFLEALGTVRDAAWTACVIGAGPEEAALRELSRSLELEGRVVWTGSIPAAGAIVSAFDLFALSSRTEGTPMVVLEAMEAGVPIVATSVGGVPELLGQPPTGWLVAPENPQAFGAALREALIDRTGAAGRAASAQSRVRTACAAGAWLDRHEAIYRRLSTVRS